MPVNQHHLLAAEPSQDGLRVKSIRGALSSTAAEGLCFVLRIASTAVLARVLLPEHFGLITMITAVTVIVDRFKDVGLSDFTVQRHKISQNQVNSLFWINFTIGLVVMFIVAALSPVFAWFYNDRRLAPIAVALSLNFLFGGLTIQHHALLRRQMRFASLAQIKIIATAVGITVGISLALQGYGHWALVWKEISTSVFTAIGTWIKGGWRPSLPVRISEVSPMLRFGRDITVFNVMYFISQSLGQILLGKFSGPALLGLYRQAHQLITIPISQLQGPLQLVAMPALSRLQKEPERYRRYYEKSLSLLLFISMPVAMYIAIFSESIVRLVLGDKWSEAAPVLTMLAIGGLIHPVIVTIGIVLVSSGNTKRYSVWGIMSAMCIGLAICGGLPWGPVGVAAAYSAADYVILICSLAIYLRDTPVPRLLVVKTMSSPLLCSVMMGIVLLLSARSNVWISSPAGIPISICVAVAAYFGFWLLLPEGKQKLTEYLTYPFVALRAASLIPAGKK